MPPLFAVCSSVCCFEKYFECSTLRACSITVQAAIFLSCVARFFFSSTGTFSAMDQTKQAKDLVRKWNGNYEYL